MSLRVHSVATASALICVAWLSLEAQDYHEAVQHGRKAWERGACKDAEDSFQKALNAATARVGVATRSEESSTRILLTEAAMCVGDYDDALENAKELQSQLSAASPEHAQVQFLEAEAEKAKSLYAEADKNYDAAVRATRQSVPVPALNLARYLGGWSDLARIQGDLPKAEERIKQALAASDPPATRNSMERAFVDVVAGDLARERGHYSEARQRYGEALSITEHRAPENPLAGRASVGIGLIELANDNPGLAEPQIKKAEDASRRIPNSDVYLRAADARGMLELAKQNLKAARDSFGFNLDALKMNRNEQHPGIAVMMDHLGLVDLAEKHFDEAIARFKEAEGIQRRYLGEQHPGLATTLQYLGRAYRLKGSFAEAQKSFEEALRIQIAKLDKDSPALTATRFEEASLFLEQGKLAEAEPLYRDALLGPHEMRLYADAIRGLALVLRGEKKNADAAKMVVDWMELRGHKLPAADPERLPVTMAAAEVCLEGGEYSEAESKFREVLAAGDKLGIEQRSTMQKELADSLFGQHKCQAAEELYKSVLPSLPDQPAAQSWERLAACYTAQKQGQKSVEAWQAALKLANKPGFPEAERQRIRLTMVEASLETGQVDQARLDEWLKARAKLRSRLTADETSILEKTARTLKAKEQYAMAETVFGMLLDESIGAAPGAIQINPTLTDFAEVSAKQNKNAQAAAVYERLAMRTQAVRLSDSEKYLVAAEKLRGQDGKPLELAATMRALGDTYVQESKYSDARPWFEKAGETLKQAGSGDSPNYAATLNGLGRVAQAERKFEQAESLFEQAYNLLMKTPDPPRTIKASVLFNRGNLKQSNGKTVEANADFDLCLKLSQGVFTRENPPPVAEFDRIAAFYADQNWYDKAEARYQSNLTLRRDIFGENSTEAGWGWYQLATFYNSTKAYDKAADDAERAWHIFEASAGRESDEVSMTLSVLSKAYHMEGKGELAIDAAERSLAIQTKLGRPNEELNQTLSSLGELLMCPCAPGKTYLAPLPGNHDHKDFDKALKVYQRQAELWNKEAFNDLNYRRAVRNIVIAYVYVKDFDSAKKLYRQLSAKLKDPDQLKTAAEAYAYALQENGRAKEAQKISPPKGG